MSLTVREQRIKNVMKLALENGGMLTTAQIEASGIGRTSIPELVASGLLSKESRGIYYVGDELPDECYILQRRSKKLVFSYGSALYLWGISDRVPHFWDVTVPQGFNSSRFKRRHEKVRFHYVLPTAWEVGIAETTTSYGNIVRLYDKERCFVDLVKRKEHVDAQLYVQTLQEYFASQDTDVVRLIRYARIFHLEKQIKDYVNVLSR